MSSAQVSIDDLSRNPNDGFYHCPSCEAPFTRRSNLRRHYVLHTRNMPFKCSNCSEQFARSDQLQHHLKECKNNYTDSLSMPDSPYDDSFDFMSALYSGGPMSFLENASHSRTSSVTSDTDQFFADFTSSFPPSSTDNLIRGMSSAIQPDQALSSTNSNSPPLPLLDIPSVAPNRAPQSFRRHRGAKPYSGGGTKSKGRERPIYTRRQVDDMLDAVSRCHLGMMDEIFKRFEVHSKSMTAKGQVDPHTKNSRALDAKAAQELQSVFNETLPRLFSGLQTFLGEKSGSS